MRISLSSFLRSVRRLKLRLFGRRPLGSGGAFLLPLTGLLVLTLAASAVTMSILIARIDRDANHNMTRLYAQLLDREIHKVRDSAHQRVNQLGTARHLYGQLDTDWADSNLTYPTSAQVYQTYAFVIDRAGTIYWSKRPAAEDGSAVPDSLNAYAPALERVLTDRLPPDITAARRMTGLRFLATFDGRPAAVGASTVLPAANEPSPAEPRYLVYIKILDATTLESWEDLTNITNVRWSKTPPQARDGMPVEGADGLAMGYLTWPGQRAGEEALAKLAPWLGLGLLIFAALAWWLIRVAQSSQLNLANSATASAVHASAAEGARREAEAALLAADEIQRQLQVLADRQVEDHQEHLKQLAEARQRIGADLRTSMARLVAELSEAASALEASAHQTESEIDSQAKGSELARSRARDAASAAISIAATVRELATSIAKIREAAASTRESAERANEKSTKAREANEVLMSHVALIRDGTSLISQISHQTNTLALNASIEASRAGLAGEGFAVVASEIKALAKRAADTLRTIEERITGIKKAADVTVESVDAVDGLVAVLVGAAVSGEETVLEQEKALALIRDTSDEIDRGSQIADEAVASIVESFIRVTEAAEATKTTGLQVRYTVEKLEAEFERIVLDLERDTAGAA